MSKELMTGAIQLLISLGGAGLVVQLLLLRQNRRKIAGEASSTEANAASTLSGAALTMVENAQADAREAKADAKQAREENERLWAELERARWRVHHLEMREAVLANALQQAGIDVPPAPPYDPTQGGMVTQPPPAPESTGHNPMA